MTAPEDPFDVLARSVRNLAAPLKSVLDTHEKFVTQNTSIAANLSTIAPLTAKSVLRISRSSVMSYSTAATDQLTTPYIATSENAGPIEQSIVEKVVNGLHPTYLTVANDSHKHAHHAGLRGATNKTESHFRLDIVSDAFLGKNMPARHRLVYHLLDEEFQQKGLHALQLKTKTLEESQKAKIN